MSPRPDAPDTGQRFAMTVSVLVLVVLGAVLLSLSQGVLYRESKLAGELPPDEAQRLRNLAVATSVLFAGFFVLGALGWGMAVWVARRIRAGARPEATGIEAALSEVSERYSLSRREMRRYGRQLESELAETEAELAHAERLAALGQMAAGIAHEVRNPLGVISAAAYYLRDSVDSRDDEAGEQVRIIEREVGRMEATVNSLLGFARMSASYDARAHPLRELLSDALGSVRAVGKLEGLTVDLDAPDPGPDVWVDGEQVSRAFVNLLDNAAAAMDGRGTITIAVALDEIDGQAVVRVSDTGCGIPADRLGVVFDLFYSTREGGTGLGLAICKGIIERAGGSITAASTPGRGATFTVRLPLAAAGAGTDRETGSTMGTDGNT